MKRSHYAKLVYTLAAAACVAGAYAMRADATTSLAMVGLAGTLVGKEFLRQTVDK